MLMNLNIYISDAELLDMWPLKYFNKKHPPVDIMKYATYLV
jgi:hypothetical protein